MDIMKMDITALSKKAQKIIESSDKNAIKDLFGNCKSIDEINKTADDLYDQIFTED